MKRRRTPQLVAAAALGAGLVTTPAAANPDADDKAKFQPVATVESGAISGLTLSAMPNNEPSALQRVMSTLEAGTWQATRQSDFEQPTLYQHFHLEQSDAPRVVMGVDIDCPVRVAEVNGEDVCLNGDGLTYSRKF